MSSLPRGGKLPKEVVHMLLGLPAPFPTWTWLLLPLGTRDPPVRASMGGGTEAGRRPQSLKCKVPTAAKEGGHVESHIYMQHWTVISEAQAPKGPWGVTSEQPELHQANYLFAPTPPPRVSSSSHLAGGFFVTVALGTESSQPGCPPDSVGSHQATVCPLP